MIETMVEYHGVGLAAPQVHEGLRLFVAIARREDEADDPDSGADCRHQPGDHAVGRRSGRGTGKDVSAFPTSAAACRGRARSRFGRSIGQGADRASGARFPGPGDSARNRSPRRHPVFRSDAVVRVADVSGRIRPILGQGLNAFVSLLLHPSFCLQPLQFDLGMIRESHGVGDRPMTGDVCDRAMHELAHTTVGGMTLWR